MLILLLLIWAGCAVWWAALQRYRAGDALWEQYIAPPAAGEFHVTAITLVAWVLVPAFTLVAFGTERSEHSLSLLFVIGLGQLLVILFTASLVLLGKRRRLSFGIRLDNIGQQLSYGVEGILAAVPPVALAALATSPYRDESTQHLLLQMLHENPGWQTTGSIIVVAAILAPIAEELVFRGVLQSTLESVLRPTPAVVVVAVLFSAVHGWPDMVPLFPLALLLGLVFHVRRSLISVITMHFLFNATNLFFAIMSSPVRETIPVPE